MPNLSEFYLCLFLLRVEGLVAQHSLQSGRCTFGIQHAPIIRFWAISAYVLIGIMTSTDAGRQYLQIFCPGLLLQLRLIHLQGPNA